MSHPAVLLLTRPHTRRRNARSLLTTSPDAIVEQGFVPLGGIEQWASIRGEDRRNPALLLLHGGPGATSSPFIPALRPLERHFTVVHWDQRGAGKTFGRAGKAGSADLSIERLAADAVELIGYLRERLSQERVLLVGSSFGSLVGITVARRWPELLHAYVGVDQNSPGCTELACRQTLAWLREAGNATGAAAVERLWHSYPHMSAQELDHFHRWQLKAGATRGLPDMVNDVTLPAMLGSPNHSLKDLGDIMGGMQHSLPPLADDLQRFDFERLGRAFEVPFFVFQGECDVFTPAEAAQAYLAAIQAPRKGFACIRGAGHLAAFSHPAQFLAELLTNVRPLIADAGTPRHA